MVSIFNRSMDSIMSSHVCMQKKKRHAPGAPMMPNMRQSSITNADDDAAAGSSSSCEAPLFWAASVWRSRWTKAITSWTCTMGASCGAAAPL